MSDSVSVSSVALGCWPIAGITSVGVTYEQSVVTVQAAFDAGVTHFDTAHAYGYDGESERIVGEVLKPVRDQVFVATKGGLVWDPPSGPGKRPQRRDGRPDVLKQQCDESLQRLGFDRIDLYYLHAPDPHVPIAEQAGAMAELLDEGKIASVGVSNFSSVAQYEQFSAVCPIAADQQPYNMLQRDIEQTVMPWTRQRQIPTMVYWPLMKGLLAGKITRDYQFDESDSRLKYPIFQGELRERAHLVLDQLAVIAADVNATIAQLVVAWTASRPGVGSVLCGAKRPDQIVEVAKAMSLTLNTETVARVDAACDLYHGADA